MFWSGNYIAVRELNSLLKEENVTLSQVLEADDILQECKADNKALIQFLTRPEILADLITLITEEPPKNVELASQYRHANIACEVLTSHLSMLSDRLSLNTVQMNRLCDFLNKDPPLNPLLASYFSKTVEMLLGRSPKQDWCLHHIVCLRVLDFFKSRRDFLPNLFKHMSTSAIADIFKCLMRIDDLINTVMEWLEEYQFLECLIQIICGTYVPEVFPPAQGPAPDAPEKAQRETSEKALTNHTDDKDSGGASVTNDTPKSDASNESGEPANGTSTDPPPDSDDSSKAKAAAEAEATAEAEAKALASERMAAAASANAAALLCDLIVNGCRLSSVRRAVSALREERGAHWLLRAMFTSPARARSHALVHGSHVLLALLHREYLPNSEKTIEEEAQSTYEECEERSSVELAVAPHLPLLHQALLQAPGGVGGVGLARVQVAALLAHLALSEVEEVATTMLTLGTPGVLLDMFFEYTNNNFLHAQVYTLVKHALNNRVYRAQYARHLVIECDLLTRLMDLFEDNKNNACTSRPRSAHMGHAVLCLGALARALGSVHSHDSLVHSLQLQEELAQRWDTFVEQQLRPLLQQHDTPLGGYYPPENSYEVEVMPDTLTASYDLNDMSADGTIDDLIDDCGRGVVSEMCSADGLDVDDTDRYAAAKKSFMEMACQRFDDHMWDEPGDTDGDADVPADMVRDVLEQHSPWESVESGSCGGEGWAQFGAEPARSPPTPPADQHFAQFSPFWSYDAQRDDAKSNSDLETSLRALRLEDKSMDEAGSAELANNLLTAMSAMSADAIANIVNANLPAPEPPTAPAEPPTAAAAPPTAPAALDAPPAGHR